MKTYTLLASAPDIEGLMGSIDRFYCGTKITIDDNGNLIRVSDSKHLDKVRVIKKGKRYRFEMVQE